MSKRLPVPADLEHLIEKREDESDRRGRERRGAARTAGKAAADGDKSERRGQVDRRRKPRRRRKADS